MAKATVEKTVKVILELSQEEAEMVMALVGACSALGMTARIWDALNTTGINPYAYEVQKNVTDPITLTKAM